MKKKLLVAFYVTKTERLLKFWNCKVSQSATEDDVCTPNRTVFFFFTEGSCDNLEITQLNFSDHAAMVWLEEKILESFVKDNKIYSFGKRKGESLIIKDSNSQICIDYFFKTFEKFNIELI